MKRTLMVLPCLLLLVLATRAPAQRYGDPRYGDPRYDDPRYQTPDLNGTWYLNGDDDRPCAIMLRPDGRALFINEHGSRARGEINGDHVWVPDWNSGDGGRGLEGRVRGDRIVWPDGSFWSRWAR